MRDDKTPFFKELENKLRQNEVTNEVAEEAVMEYLEKLHLVANLEICGLHREININIVHVIGRTKDIPHKYFYRNQKNHTWSPWEQMDVDIEGDHILPLVWNGRLMLFWQVLWKKKSEKI